MLLKPKNLIMMFSGRKCKGAKPKSFEKGCVPLLNQQLVYFGVIDEAVAHPGRDLATNPTSCCANLLLVEPVGGGDGALSRTTTTTTAPLPPLLLPHETGVLCTTMSEILP